MRGIDPKWIMWLGLLVTIEHGISAGTLSLTNMIPDAWIITVKAWSSGLEFIGTAIMTWWAAVSSPQAGPMINTPLAPVTKLMILLAVLAASAFAFPGDAQAQQPRFVKPTGNIVNDIAAATGSKTTITGAPVTDIQNFLNAKFLPDLQYALKLATASKNSVTADCYQAWIDIITTQQTAVNDSATPPQPLPMPDPHVITEFEKLVELRNALQPESQFMIKCSPVASMIKMDIAQFMGIVISGGAGLATLVPGL